jgi:glycine oxidase
MAGNKDIIIIGGGAIGCSIAYHLAKKGVTSTIIEKESIGSRASGKAWAIVRYPPYIFTTAKYPGSYYAMPEEETVLRWQYLYWASYYRMANLALEIKEKGNIDIEFGSFPMSYLAFSEETERTMKQLMSDLKENGYYEYEWLGPDDLNEIFPGINPEVRGGLSLPQHQLEPYKYTLGLTQAAEALGAEVRHGNVVGFETSGERITSIRLASGNKLEADLFVIAMGPWSGQAASQLGNDIPAFITVEECLRVKVPRGFPQHSLSGGITMISTKIGDVILATAEVKSKEQYYELKKRPDFNADLSDEIAKMNIEAALTLLPDLLQNSELVEHRGDLLAYGPPPFYQKPVIGSFPRWENGYVATRFGGMGVNMSVGTGEIMADLIVDSEVPFTVRKMVEHLSPA